METKCLYNVKLNYFWKIYIMVVNHADRKKTLAIT
uniref:Uncharacterized protein n=1 Tax=Candidatus Methanophaga sp. ANME-1 ERB7 TaxID=2759913 RepID=A0A7G9Z7T7_9EURY|nr:hypothetical protein HFIEAGJK_00038 [Methanosarcinales archaeon ANME-1 ERB7]